MQHASDGHAKATDTGRHAASRQPAAAQAGARRSRAAASKLPARTVSRPELLVDGSDRDFRRLVHGLFGFLASHEEIRAGHARYIGLAGIEYTVLISIAHLAQAEDVSVSRIAAHLHLTGAFITTVVQRLQSHGLVVKRPHAKDRRRVVLTVTPKGRRLLERLAPVQRQVNDVEFGCLSAAEFRYSARHGRAPDRQRRASRGVAALSARIGQGQVSCSNAPA